VAVLRGLVDQVGRDLLDGVVVAHLDLTTPGERAHLDEVDDTDEVVLGADRKLYHQRRGAQALDDRLDGEVEVRAELVHLVDEADAGTSYLSAWRHTVSDCGSTPSLPSKTATAPSRTRRERSTSTVKSTWPGCR
jgi:hypothetical protein